MPSIFLDILIKNAIDPSYRSEYTKLKNEVEELEPGSEAFKQKSKDLKTLYKESAKDTKTNDRDYMFIRFILNHLHFMSGAK